MGRDKRGGKKGPVTAGLIALGFVIGAAFVLLFLKYGLDRPRRMEPPRRASVPPGPVEPAPIEPSAEPPVRVPDAARPPARYARIAIVIDDMGRDIHKLESLFEVNAPITIAIIPDLRHSVRTAKETNRKGWDVIVHLPMEPKDLGDHDPGQGVLLTTMSGAEVRARVEDAFSKVPYARGVNNHMGSRFTENEALMREVLDVVKKKDFFFLDSRTSSDSVAGRLARDLGVRNADRSVFLDNTRDEKYIKGQIAELVSVARRHGYAIGIGHPYPETIEALKATVSGLNGEGVRVVRLSELVK